MSDKPPNARSQHKMRLPEHIRAAIEKEAAEFGASFNSVIVRRLEQTMANERLGETIFGDREIYEICDELVRIVRVVERTAGRRWNDGTVEGRDVMLTAFKTMTWVIEHGPSLIAGGPLPVLRGVESRIGLAAMAAMAENFSRYRQGLEAAVSPSAPSSAQGDAAPTPADEAA